ncbi:MAG: NAD(P)-dependent oxidoreductase [Vicingaceae bacterium]
MRIGIIKEGKNPPDERVPFTPEQCRLIQARYPQIELFVQRSPVRTYADEAYAAHGVVLVDDLSEVDVIFGVKEVQLEDLIADKTYFFFSHTIKKQPYNRKLLQTVLERRIKLVDYECLTSTRGHRLLGFGRYAGIVGAYNAFLAYGKRSGAYELKPAYKCHDRKEMESYLGRIKLPRDFKIVMSGTGRVAGGVMEIIDKMGIQKVSPKEFLEKNFNHPVISQLSVEDYFRKPDGSSFEREEAFDHPERFESDFMKYAKVADMYITAHFWDASGPRILTEENLASTDFTIRTIADISCDIAGPIASTIRPSTIEKPIYEVNRQTLQEVDEAAEDTITVMAVDNLPCELPKDASEDFGEELIKIVLPNLIGSDDKAIIEGGTITQSGKLMPNFSYLHDYVEGKK